MIYDLLKDMQSYLASKATPGSTEQELLDRLNRSMATVHRSDDTDYLHPNEILVRICPCTKRPVLVCHTGDGYAVCLRNGNIEEDAEDVQEWLKSCGKITSCTHTPTNNGYFPITSVHRDDLEAKGFDTAKITDDQMKELAKRMANDYCEQLFWDSMTIIAELMGLSKKRGIPDDDIYVLVEFPEDAASFEEEGIGYPAWNSEDNGARYVQEYDYIRHFHKTPAENSYYKPLRWPESQRYLFPDEPNESIDALSEPINDEKGIADFGEQAIWVPLCIVQ